MLKGHCTCMTSHDINVTHREESYSAWKNTFGGACKILYTEVFTRNYGKSNM